VNETIEQKLKKDGKHLETRVLREGQEDEARYSVFHVEGNFCFFREGPDYGRFGKLLAVYSNATTASEAWLDLTYEAPGLLDLWDGPHGSGLIVPYKEQIVSTPVGLPVVLSNEDHRRFIKRENDN